MTAKFTELWFSESSCTTLASLARSVESLDGDIVEVGSWQGRSTCALANAVHPATVHAVDTWQGSSGEISEFLAGRRDVYAEFVSNVEALTNGNVVAHRMGWREYFATNLSRVRFCFVDAEHTYTEVRDTVIAVLPKMVPGGLIVGDDIHHPPVQRAVIDVLGVDGVMVDGALWSWRAP
jgi:predicted O-methyltransferase YrrM